MSPRSQVQMRTRRGDSRISGEVRRLDDLRAVEIRRLDELRVVAIQRLDELSHAERKADRKLAKVQVKRLAAMQVAEARRVDSLLADAKAAVTLSNSRAEMTAATLAEKVTDSAAALAEKGEAIARAAAAATEATAKALSERIGPLEEARYEARGGRDVRTETREQSHWTTERIFAVIVIAVGVIEFILRSGVIQ